MKMGFVSSILENYTFEEVIDFASENGFKCVELASWKKEKAERRYAGVSILTRRALRMKRQNIFLITAKAEMLRFRLLPIIPTPWIMTLKKERLI